MLAADRGESFFMVLCRDWLSLETWFWCFVFCLIESYRLAALKKRGPWGIRMSCKSGSDLITGNLTLKFGFLFLAEGGSERL